MPVNPEYKPDYQLIIDYVTARIASGDWPPGHKLPPPAELATVIDPPTSSATVRRATDTLQDRGVLVGRQGKGVYVAEHPRGVTSTS
jgi:GntR family transcriptional regulator